LGAGIKLIPDCDLLQWYLGVGHRSGNRKPKDGEEGKRVHWMKTNVMHHSDADASSGMVKEEREVVIKVKKRGP
jgi:hypothetical protein